LEQTVRHEFAHSLDTEPLYANIGETFGRRVNQPDWAHAATSDWEHTKGLFPHVVNPVEVNKNPFDHGLVWRPGAVATRSGPTQYGRTSPEEDFSESFAMYTKDRKYGMLGMLGIAGTDGMRFDFRFADLYPHRARYFDEVLGLAPAELSTLSKYRIAALTAQRGPVSSWTVTMLIAELRSHGIDPAGMSHEEMIARLQSLGVNTEMSALMGDFAA
jgi:hypothetical protein